MRWIDGVHHAMRLPRPTGPHFNTLMPVQQAADLQPRDSDLSLLQGFLAPGTDVTPIVPALEKIWADSLGQSLADFNFRSVTSKFNDLVYQYPIRIPERYSLVIRWAVLNLVLWGLEAFSYSRGCRDRLPGMPAPNGVPPRLAFASRLQIAPRAVHAFQDHLLL